MIHWLNRYFVRPVGGEKMDKDQTTELIGVMVEIKEQLEAIRYALEEKK